MKANYSISFRSLICALVVFSCSDRKQSDDTLMSGEALAKQYCSSCHLFPEPHLLDKETWADHTLPAMGYRFGIYQGRARDSLIEKGSGGRIVERANVFPRQQLITDDEWEQIRKFYIDQAPDRLISKSDTVASSGQSIFCSVATDFKIDRPAVSALVFDKKRQQLYVADCSRENYSTVTILNSSFKPVTSLGLPHPVSNLALLQDTLYILSMGHFVPSDEPAGQLIKAVKNSSGEYEGYQRVLKNLKRPVDIAYGDLNDDGTDEIVVCEFGNHTGSVSLFSRNEKGSFDKDELFSAPGAVKVALEDMDKDNVKDIVVLMAQGDEGIDIYFNRGNLKFERKRILRFPPVYGSVSFCLADVNNDGNKDIVYVNGDNADASQILKPYHGIRLFISDANNSFFEAYFFSMHGAYKAIAHDFDKDGDIDIAAISFFPDFEKRREQGFIYLENRTSAGRLSFFANSIDVSTGGRWITMINCDWNRDGFEDLAIGSFTSLSRSEDTTSRADIRFKETMSLLLLENSLK